MSKEIGVKITTSAWMRMILPKICLKVNKEFNK